MSISEKNPKILKWSYLALVPVVFFSFYYLIRTKSHEQKPIVIRGQTMGTYYVISYFAKSNNEMTSNDVDRHIKKDLAEVNRQMSTYQENSEISLFNRYPANEKMPISSWFATVLQYSLQLAKETSGYFDPTVGPLVNLWGFGPEGAKDEPNKGQILKTMEFVGYKKIHLNKRTIYKRYKDELYTQFVSNSVQCKQDSRYFW